MSFDEYAKTWDADPKKVERAEILAKLLSKFSKDKRLSTAMEFGCGTGLLSFFLKDEFSNITLADTSPGMIEVLKEKIEIVKVPNFYPVLLEDKTSLPNCSFDIIYSSMTMHHVTNLDAVFLEFDSLLKPKGFLCIADLVEEDGNFHSVENSKHVHHGFYKDKLIAQLETYGFEFVDYHIFYTIEKVNELGIKKGFPLFLLIVQKKV